MTIVSQSAPLAPASYFPNTTRAKDVAKWCLILALAIATRWFAVAEMYRSFPPGWGGEMPAVAESIAAGHGFASPYMVATGPTALVPPVYPFLLSILFRLFGLHTALAGIVALGLNVFLSSLVVVPLFVLTSNLWRNTRTASVAVWAWAALPLAGYTGAQFVWNTSLYTLTLTTFLAFTTVIERNNIRRWWPYYGALTSFLVVVEPISLTVVAVAFLWLLYRNIPAKTLILAAAVGAILPSAWMVRNVLEFHQPVFLRSGFGLELSSGVRSFELAGQPPSSLPNRDPVELAKYEKMGELNYFHARLKTAEAWIRSHPREYETRVVKRAASFWTGRYVARSYLFPRELGSAERLFFALPAIGGFLGLFFIERRALPIAVGILLLYPIAFYVTHIELRQRFPIEPLLLALTVGAAFKIWELVRRWPVLAAPTSATG